MPGFFYVKIANLKKRRIDGMGKNFNATEFFRGLEKANQRQLEAARKATAETMLHIERSAKKQCPIETGTLAAGIRADVENLQVSRRGVKGQIIAGGGESADYALTQHEAVLTHSYPKPGVYASKFLEIPTKEAIETFRENLVSAVKEAL